MNLLSPRSFLSVSIGIFLLALVPCKDSLAGTTTVAITGAAAPGTTDALFNNLTDASISNNGKIVFTASLALGPGGVTPNEDEGIWWLDGASTSLIAREGTAGVPDIPGANFNSFSDATIDDQGNLRIRASLKTNGGSVTSANNQGIWNYQAGVGTISARTGSLDAPGLAGADFESLPPTLRTSSDGRMTLSGTLIAQGGVTNTNDKGVWSYTNGIGTLVSREDTSSVPGVAGSSFSTFGNPAINSSNQTLFLGSLKLGGTVTSTNRLGLWQYTGTNGVLVSRVGVGNVPGVAGANFLAFNEYRQNNPGQIAINASLDTPNGSGVWLYSGSSGTLLARKGVGGVPGVSGANFENFDTPIINDLGQVLVRAELEVGPGGVSASNRLGLWLLDESGSLELRTGSGGVPGVPAANFENFSTYALNEAGQLAVAATLELGTGGVDSTNNSGLWLIDPEGVSRLIARKGDTLAGRTIEAVDFLGGSAASDGQSSGLNDLGNVAFQTTFTNGDSGIFLFNPRDADFDFNGQVDTDDYLIWDAGFGANSGANQMLGDADNDQDIDGLDFLILQREFGTGVPSPPLSVAIPEPNSLLLLSIGLLGSRLALRRQKS